MRSWERNSGARRASPELQEWTGRRFGRCSLSAQVRRSSGYFGDDAETPNLHIAPATTVDARVSWQRGAFTIFGFAQNLFDKFHITSWSDLRDRPNVQVTTNDSREIGLGVETRF